MNATQAQAFVVKDSINWTGHRLTTVQVRFPRSILSELNTHRVFSRNARSSRAVPTSKLCEEVRDDPFVPNFYGNQKGMIATAQKIEDTEIIDAWFNAMRGSVESAEKIAEKGSHKQYQNRLLEPFAYVDALISSTEWNNFFIQRIADDAEPNMRMLAMAINETIIESEPKELKIGEYHLPFVQDNENELPTEVKIKISVARCARISVTPFDSKRINLDKDLELFEFLRDNGHASPFEHIARVPSHIETFNEAVKGFIQLICVKQTSLRYGNFAGWFQFRKEF